MSTSAEKEVWEMIRAFNRAFMQNEPDAYFAFVAPDVSVYTPSNPYRVDGYAADREEFEYSLRLGRTRVGLFQEMQPMVCVYGETAVVTYFARGTFGAEAKWIYWKETDVAVKRDGNWKIVHIHVSTTN